MMRKKLCAAVSGVVFVIANYLSGASLHKDPPAPNVLFIAVDDLKPLLGCYGDPIVKTPNIDRLASKGTVFLNAHCQQAVCGPSRASLLTGLRPDSTRVWDLKTKIREMTPEVVTLSQHFKLHGYESVGTGKIFDFRSVEGHEQDDPASWSRPYVVFPKNPDAEFGCVNPAFVQKVRALRDQGINGHGELVKALGGTPPIEIDQDVPDSTYEDGAIAETGIALLQELSASDTPFFLAVGFKKPHLPFVAPKKYADLYEPKQFALASVKTRPEGSPEYHWQPGWELRNGAYCDVPLLDDPAPVPDDMQLRLIHGYYACVSYVDAQIGRLLDALEQSGKADNTLIVLWGDHGFHLGDHGMWCKHTNYEQSTRVPLIFVDPRLPGGQTNKSPVEFVDIYPTLCDLSGLPIPKPLEGISLSPILKDSNSSVKPVAISQFPRFVSDGVEAMGYAYRDERFRYIEWIQKDYRAGETGGTLIAEEFYDYEADPQETQNLIDDPAYSEPIQKLRNTAAELHPEIMRNGDTMPPSYETIAQTDNVQDPAENLAWKEADELITYHQPSEGELKLHVFKPADWKAADRRPAIVWFHGGAWKTGDARAFYWQSNYLSSRGMVCICPEYRIESLHGTSPVESTRDAMRAMQYVRAHADEFGIDPDRIAAGGGSAGGHLAASLAMVKGFEDAELSGTSPIPNALLLFNPVLDTTEKGFGSWWVPDPEAISPITQMSGQQPPAIIFNGALDQTTTLERARAFTEKMNSLGNRCELVVYPQAEHSFFHRGTGDEYFADTLRRTELFLESLEWLKPSR
jgi:arylsulfatase A-like enzyme/dienelactone hydrolase